VWRLYLAGGGLAFEGSWLGVDQVLAVKSAAGEFPVRGQSVKMNPDPGPV
jgi:hypothetical protein